MKYILAHDLGTSGNKATLFSDEGKMITSEVFRYDCHYFNTNWAEQDPEDFWKAICVTSRNLIDKARIDPGDIAAVSFSGQMMGCLCVDTVMDPETARMAILSGAQYVVSPYFNGDTVRLCNRYRVACMPGAMSIAEVVAGMEAGADIIKVFPGELFGPKILKSIHGPIPQAELMPTGGVSLDNVAEWIAAGAVAVGAGGSLTAGAKTGDYGKITETARQFVEKIRAARGQ